MSPVMAFGYLFWTQWRRGPIVLGGCWLVLAILCRILPIASLHPSILMVVLWIPGMFAFSALMGTFMFTLEKNSWMHPESRESCFPSRLWVLPLRTWALVSWPMFWGMATLALFWLAWAVGILRPCGFKAPLVWPSLLLAAVLAWLQALAWSPFPLPWLRILVGMPILFAFEMMAMLLYVGQVSERVCCGVLIVLLATAYAIAVAGVARSRRGDVPKWSCPRWFRTIADWLLVRRQPLLSSPMQAQRWFEWRRGGRTFPITLGLILLIWLPCVPWFAFGIQEEPLAKLSPILPSLLREVGSLWLAMGSLLPLPLSLAMVAGMRMGPLPGQDRMSVFSSFMATRPISCWDLIRAKLQTAALSMLAGWAVMSVGVLLWAALSGYGVEMAVQFEAVRQHHPAERFWTALILLLGGSLLLTWMWMAGHLWAGLLRQEAWPKTFLVVTLGVLLVAIIIGQRWEEIADPWQTFLDLLPWLAGGAIALKCLAAAWALNRLKRNALVPPHVLIGTLAAWCTLAIGLFVVLRWLIPHEIMPTSGLVLGIVLLVPLTRLALAPLALMWNRHR